MEKPTSGAAFRYFILILGFAGITIGIIFLLLNIMKRQEEAKSHFLKVVELDENSTEPEQWRPNFPRQYDGYIKTVDILRTKHGGSENIDKLKDNPLLKRLFAGYAFSIDFREDRGHGYMLKDQDETERVKQRKQPGACLHCHANVIPAYRKLGNGDIQKGFEAMCAMPWTEARKEVHGGIACLDCHDPKTTQLRVTRPAFLNGIQVLAKSKDPVPHLPSVERWREGSRKKDYDPNALATRQEMRSLVCAQCHVEYYFKPDTSVLTYPWANGLKVDQIEAYYDEIGFKDWVHKDSGAAVLKAQHPEFELWSQGIHARAGVSCADCHMPYLREGAVKITDHHIRSPLLMINRACQTCHRADEKELLARTEAIQERTLGLLRKAEQATVDLIDLIAESQKSGMEGDRLDAARKYQRKAQFRVDFIGAENSLFHAPQESCRILGDAIDYARRGQFELLKRDGKK